MMFDLPLPLMADAGAPPPPIVPLKQETFTNAASVAVPFGNWEFEEVYILVDQWQPSADAVPWLRTSGDGGATFDSGASDYRANGVQHEPGSTVAGFSLAISYLQLGYNAGSGRVDGGVGLACFLIRLWRPYEASERTYVHMFGGWDRNGVSNSMNAYGGGWRDATGKVDAALLLPSAGTMDGRLAAWGMLSP